MAKWNRTDIAVCEEAEGLGLPLLVGEHKEAVELARGCAVLDTPHVGEAHSEGVEMLGLEVLHTADEKGALGSDLLELGIVRPELVAHVIALVKGHL